MPTQRGWVSRLDSLSSFPRDFTSDCVLELITLTSISTQDSKRLNPHLGQQQERNARQRASADVFQSHAAVLGAVQIKNREQMTSGDTQTDWWNTSDWQKQKYAADERADGPKGDWGTIWQSGNRCRARVVLVKLKTACVLLLMFRKTSSECQHRGLPADLSRW